MFRHQKDMLQKEGHVRKHTIAFYANPVYKYACLVRQSIITHGLHQLVTRCMGVCCYVEEVQQWRAAIKVTKKLAESQLTMPCMLSTRLDATMPKNGKCWAKSKTQTPHRLTMPSMGPWRCTTGTKLSPRFWTTSYR